jgi:hypothetical protein
MRATAGGLPGIAAYEETALCAAVLAAYSRDELEMLLYQHCGGIRLDVITPVAVTFEVTVSTVVAADPFVAKERRE